MAFDMNKLLNSKVNPPEQEKEVLTIDQSDALEKMLNPHSDTFILKGYAGTGKTFLLKHFIREVRNSGKNVWLTATTNKAVGVARGDCTVHSYLGLVLKKERNRQVLRSTGKSKAWNNDVVIVDEASMVGNSSDSPLLRYILEAQEDYNLRLVFVGDPAQIPPVNEKESPVWGLEDVDSFQLTDIVRQAAGSNIIQLATRVRQGVFQESDIDELTNGTDVLSGKMKEAKQFFVDNIGQDESGVYTFPQILSYRNLIVDDLNSWARRKVLGATLEDTEYTKGEMLYIRSAYEGSTFRIEDFVEIQHLENPKPHYIDGPNRVETVKMMVRNQDTGVRDWIIVPLTAQDASNFQRNKDFLAKKAIESKYWGNFWAYAESVTDVKHIYAMTCHRSQGSTFQDTIVNRADVLEPRLFYTALTRASKRAFIAK